MIYSAPLDQEEARLDKKLRKAEILKGLPLYPHLTATLRALEAAKPEVLSLYPYLEPEFTAAAREGEALDRVLEGDFSRFLLKNAGTEAYPIASTMLLADFQRDLEEGSNDLMAKGGWI